MPPSGALPNATGREIDGRTYWVAPLTGKQAVTVPFRLAKLAGPLLEGAAGALADASSLSVDTAVTAVAGALSRFLRDLDPEALWLVSEVFHGRTAVQHPGADLSIPVKSTEWDGRIGAWRDYLVFCCEVNNFADFFTVKGADGQPWTLAKIKALLVPDSPKSPQGSIGISGA